MKDTDLYWLAGWLEGEASFYFLSRCNRKAQLISIAIQVFSIDRDTLERGASLMGASIRTIPPRACRGTKWTSQGGWRAELDGAAAAELMRMIKPLMGSRRRQQIEASLSAWDGRINQVTEKLCACGCGKVLVAGMKQIYIDGNHRMRAWRLGVTPKALALKAAATVQ